MKLIKDGIVKDVAENLVATYLGLGWNVYISALMGKAVEEKKAETEEPAKKTIIEKSKTFKSNKAVTSKLVEKQKEE